MKKASYKNVFIVLIAISCAVCLFIFKCLPDKMAYTVDKNEENYAVSITNNQGKKIYEHSYKSEPVISKAGENTFIVTVGRGDCWTTSFINGKTGKVSENFENISSYNENLVVYGIYDDDKLKIIIRDIYDKEKAYKEIIDDFPDLAVGSYVIKDSKVINDHLVYIKYYTGDEWEEKENLVFL